MKKIFYSLSIFAALSLASCSNILDQTPTDQFTDGQVWNDTYLIDCHLAELYHMSAFMVNDAVATFGSSPINVEYSSSSDWNFNLGISASGEGPIHSTTVADEAKYSMRGAQTNYSGMKLQGLQADAWTLRWWANGWYLNRQLNHFIEKIEDSPVSNAVALKSEARFLRAFNYFAMVKRYGGVPLITKETPIDASEEELHPARATEQECYDFIISELDEIAKLLPASPERGKAGKAAALTLLSRVALYAGSIQKYGTVALNGLNGIPAGGSNNYFEIARDAAFEVMGMGTYGLYTGNGATDFDGRVQTLRNIFIEKGNREAIMVKAHEGTAQEAYRWSWDICLCPKPNAWNVGQYSLPYFDFVEKFDFIDGTPGNKYSHAELAERSWTMDELFGVRDPRLTAWIWTNGQYWPGAIGEPILQGDGSVKNRENQISMYNGIRLADGSIWKNNAAPVYDGVRCWGDQMEEFAPNEALRHTGFGIRKYLDEGADNNVWFAMSTTDYLIFRYAEVLLNYAEACFELGEVGPATEAINQIRRRAGVADRATVTVDDIRNERAVELCFEDHRYWDLRRWRIAEAELNGSHQGLIYRLDWESYKAGKELRYWVEVYDKVDDLIKDPKFPAKNYYMPIGSGSIAKNPNIIENPGY